jgi:peptide/nickel transport system ATP-binding protein/oligopeptide transport system ATP-binding protein
VTAVLEVRDLVKHFPVTRGLLSREVGRVHAVDGLSFQLEAGKTLGLVGESGCGKSTVGRTILRLHNPTSGRILINGTDITDLNNVEMRPFRRQMQIIFQDPFSSLDPRMTAEQIVGELLSVHGKLSKAELREKVADLFEKVGLRRDQLNN